MSDSNFKKLRLVALLSLAAASAMGSIQILHPKDLKKLIKNDGFVKSSLGNFGHIVYGSSVVRYNMHFLKVNVAGKTLLPFKQYRRMQTLCQRRFPAQFYYG